MLARVAEHLRRAQHGLHDEVGGHVPGESEQDAAVDHGLGQEGEVGRARTGGSGHGVLMDLGQPKDPSHVPEELLGHGQVLVLRVSAGADHRHGLVHHHRDVGHHPDHGDALAQPGLDERGADPRGERDHQVVGVYGRAELLEQRFHVLRLHGEDQGPGRARGLRVVEQRCDAVAVRQVPGPLLAARRDQDLLLRAPARPDQPGHQCLPHLAGPQERDLLSQPPLLNRLLTKNHRFAGRSAIRRVRYGYHCPP